MFTSYDALSMLNKLKGRHRAAFWRPLGFPNCARARVAWRRERHELFLEQWRREELRGTPFVNFADPPSYEEMAARFKVAYRRRPKPIWRSRLELKGHSKERWDGTAIGTSVIANPPRTRWSNPAALHDAQAHTRPVKRRT
jgi:hypothetical protein